MAFLFQITIQKNRLSESQEKVVNLKKDLAEMQEWMTQAEEEYLERDFEYKSPEELESAVEEMKVRLGQCAYTGLFLLPPLKTQSINS